MPLSDEAANKPSILSFQTVSKHGSAAARSVGTRALALSTYFLSGALSINLSQILGTPLKWIDDDWYNAWISFTKQSFGLLMMNLTQSFAPTTVIVSGDVSVRGQIRQSSEGTLELDFPERLVLIANHQIYTDWLYLWWIAYCNRVHGYLYIILKESLKKIPVLGWGMHLSQFIFIKRDWKQDKPHMAKALRKLNSSSDPVWLLLFPEGTNLAPDTRVKSAIWARKNNIPDCRHILLPRSTGLWFCLSELRNTVQYLYDCTIAYEGVSREQYAQDIFTLQAGYLHKKPPKRVHMYWRRFRIKDIPIQNESTFNLWLLARWREKDLLIENFFRFGRFPADSRVMKTSQGQKVGGGGQLSVQIRPCHWYEFLQVFSPMGVLAMVLYIFHGALPPKTLSMAESKAIRASTEEVRRQVRNARVPKQPRSFDLDPFFDSQNQPQTFKKLVMNLAQHLQTPEAKTIITRATLVQQWLEDPQKLMSKMLEGDAELQDPPDGQSFIQALEREEEKRRMNRLESQHRHRGTFWKDVEKLAASRAAAATNTNNGTLVSAATSTFPDCDDQDETSGTSLHRPQIATLKNIQSQTSSAPHVAIPTKHGTTQRPNFKAAASTDTTKHGSTVPFWAELQKEEKARNARRSD